MPFLLSKTTVSKVVSVGLSHVIFDLHESIVVNGFKCLIPILISKKCFTHKVEKGDASCFLFLFSKKSSSYIKCVLGCHEFSSR